MQSALHDNNHRAAKKTDMIIKLESNTDKSPCWARSSCWQHWVLALPATSEQVVFSSQCDAN